MSEAYMQAFVLTMENGAVVLSVVMGDGWKDAETQARAAAEKLADCRVWAACPYPVADDLRLGTTTLRRK